MPPTRDSFSLQVHIPDATAALRWTAYTALHTGARLTRRHARRLLGAPGDFDAALATLTSSGELTIYTDPEPRGRPPHYLHPNHGYTVSVEPYGDKMLIVITPDPDAKVDLHPEFASLVPVTLSTAPSGGTVFPSEQPTNRPLVDVLDPHANEEREEAAEEREVELAPGGSEQEPIKDPDQARVSHGRDGAFTLLRLMCAKSVADRGYGPTESELAAGLCMRGWSEEEAFTYVAELTKTSKYAYMEGGLIAHLPRGPHNKTEQVRYALRPDSQAFPEPQAEFQVILASRTPVQPPDQGSHTHGPGL